MEEIIETETNVNEGANEQEIAEPVEETWEQLDGIVEDDTDIEGAKDEEAAEPQEQQTDEENSKYAAARRKAEEEFNKKLEAEKSSYQSEINDLIKSLGIASPYGDQKGIETIEDLREYSKARAEELRAEEREELLNAGLSEDRMNEIINNAVENNPAVIKAKQDAAEYERLKALEQKKATEAVMNQELSLIQQLDPTVKNLKEVFEDAKGQEISKIVAESNGAISISQAYKLIHFDDIVNRRGVASRQQAINSMSGKDHLNRSTQTGKGGVDVPSAYAAEYRWYFPNASDDEIAEEYRKYLNEEIRSV